MQMILTTEYDSRITGSVSLTRCLGSIANSSLSVLTLNNRSNSSSWPLCRYVFQGADVPWVIPAAHNLTVNCSGASLAFAGHNAAIQLSAGAGLTLNDCNIVTPTVFNPVDSIDSFGVAELVGFAAEAGSLVMLNGGSFQVGCPVRLPPFRMTFYWMTYLV